MAVIEYIVNVVGDRRVGKTAFIKRHQSGEFFTASDIDPNQVSRLPDTAVRFNTNVGMVHFTIIESEQPVPANAYILMFDVTEPSSYTHLVANIAPWISDHDMKVVCGNKVDIKERKVKPTNITIHRQLGCMYYDISAKSNYNFEKPFITLLSLLVPGYLSLVNMPPLQPPVANVDNDDLDDIDW